MEKKVFCAEQQSGQGHVSHSYITARFLTGRAEVCKLFAAVSNEK